MKDPAPTSRAPISLPKGGGAITGMGETFQPNAFSGSGNFALPVNPSPGREGFGPKLSLQYSTGNPNGPFGLGWQLSVPRITRKTQTGLPRYDGGDVFVLSGAEDLVPVLRQKPESASDESDWVVEGDVLRGDYDVKRYRPRTEGLFARVEQWVNARGEDRGDVHWRTISNDNVTSIYGKTVGARIVDPDARVDPSKRHRVHEWLLEETFDARGNHILYEYARDDPLLSLEAASERNRSYGQIYLRRIYHGNSNQAVGPLRRGTDYRNPLAQQERHYLFEVVLDYGDFPQLQPPYRPAGDSHDLTSDWPLRPDPFSTFRAGFELRTLRRCERVLMFHHFTELGGATLVKSSDFQYRTEPHTRMSLLVAATVTGYRRDGQAWRAASMPPVTFAYSEFRPQEQRYQSVGAAGNDLPAMALSDPDLALVDLSGQGLPDLLHTSPDGFRYWRNLGGGRFERPKSMPQAPAGITLSQPGVRFGDMAGNGLADLLVLSGPLNGYYETTADGTWETFHRMDNLPSVDLGDPRVQLVDLTGDGRSDALLATDAHFVWFECLGEAGFGAPRFIPRIHDLDAFPDVQFNDLAGRVRLADMNGDGLSDIVLIHSGRIDYWPNLGYGRFGKRITLARSPHFGVEFDPARLFLADLDGSGCVDLVYVESGQVRFWFNQSGNGWSDEHVIRGTPPVTSTTALRFADLFGTGTTALVWSYEPAAGTDGPLKVLDFCGGVKPYLATEMSNNLGATTRVRYGSSTRHYLRDEADGAPWLTKLPFPVLVVDEVETIDHIGRSRRVTSYRYHHGYYDGREREFRGFGRVDQIDTEAFENIGRGDGDSATEVAHDVAPVETRTWFHTGVFLEYVGISRLFEPEYFREPGVPAGQAQARLLSDTVLPPGLDRGEATDACRALKGSVLRQEIYARDGSERSAQPYRVAENNFGIKRLQPRGGNTHAVFLAHPQESLELHCERDATDPRTSHTIALEVSAFGGVLKAVTVAYGRRPGKSPLQGEDARMQEQTLVTYTENDFTCPIDDAAAYPDDHRAPLPCETRKYELTGYAPAPASAWFRPADFVRNAVDGSQRLVPVFDQEIHFEQRPSGGKERRLIEQARTLYRPDDLGAARNDPLALLPLGVAQPLGLHGERYRLAFTPGLLLQVFQGSDHAAFLPATAVLTGVGPEKGGYLPSQELKALGTFPATDPDDWLWAPTGRAFLSPARGDGAAQELAYAKQHFFLPHRDRDPFHTDAVPTESVVTYDAYDLLMVETRDALGNRLTVEANDYRVLQPRRVSDANRNQGEVAFDALGLVVGTAVMGKPTDTPRQGDSLESFDPDPSQALVDTFMALPREPSVDGTAGLASRYAQDLLGTATTRIVYDLDRFRRLGEPPCAATIQRETHVSELSGTASKLQIIFSYSDGFAREVQKKIQAEPDRRSPGVDPRWVGSGWTVFNNKGKPVRRYEPFFSPSHHFEFDARHGVSPVLFYDPADRLVAILQPNNTYTKTVFGPWHQAAFDVNDTSAAHGLAQTGDPRSDPDIADLVVRYFQTQPASWQTWRAQRVGGALGEHERIAALRAAAHADTPTTTYLDALGRPVLTVARHRVVCKDHPLDGRADEEFRTRIALDISGRQLEIRDERNLPADGLPVGAQEQRVVMRYAYDMLGNRLRQESMDAGTRWEMKDVAGKPVHVRDSRGHEFVTAYDALRRPVEQWVRGVGSECDPRTRGESSLLVDRVEYGEPPAGATAAQEAQALRLNLRTKVRRHYDPAGVVTSGGINPVTGQTEAFDFKGNLLRSTRHLASDYTAIPDWRAAPRLDTEFFTSSARYDALNRAIQSIAPHSSLGRGKFTIVQPVFNDAALMERVDVWLERPDPPAGLLDVRLEPPAPVGVADIAYDARGQRVRVDLKTAQSTVIRSTYLYEPETFRLAHLYTRRGVDPSTADGVAFTEDCENPDPPPPASIAAPAAPPAGKRCGLQNLHYTYDPAGNVTHIRDDAQQTLYFRNHCVEPSNDYVYDALYRLVQAAGREHLGQAGVPVAHSHDDAGRVGLVGADAAGRFAPTDGTAMGSYVERYVYDAVGNILQMQHRGTDPLNAGWKRTYEYLQPGAIPGGPATEPPATSNRLTRTVLNASGAAPQPEPYLHDAHGNMLRMPHLGRSPAEPNLHWDYRDHLHRIDRTADSSAFHVYDASGQRVRKVWEKAPGLVEERIYLGGFEIFRKHGGTIGPDTATLERETLHVMDGERRVALVETRTLDADGQDRAPRRLIRYQLGNHLGSATLELDEQAQIVSYEEYAPWGTSTYQAVRSATESPKRYRHTGKERDEESGLYYHGARHYAPWLGRWIAADRSGLSDGPNMFCHVHSNPVRLVDPGGHAGEETKLTKPAVVAALQQKGLPYATEVEFELLDASGKAIKSGRFDVMTVDPRNGNIIIAELKGTALDDVTKNQKIYVPILESANGGVIRITGSKGGPLGLQAGVTTRVTHDNYVRVGTKNLADFTEALHEVTGGAPVKHSFLDRAGKMHLFETTEAFNAFLEGSGRGSMLSRAAKGVRHAGPALSIVGVLAWGASAQAAETSDKPPSDQELRSYKGNLGLRLNLGATLNDTVNAAPYGDLATYLTVGIQSDAILRMKALEFATINNFRQFGGSLEQIENAPYMFDSRSGGVYQISSNATSDSDLGTLTKVKTLGKSIFGWWTDGGNVVYRDSDKKLYLNHW